MVYEWEFELQNQADLKFESGSAITAKQALHSQMPHEREKYLHQDSNALRMKENLHTRCLENIGLSRCSLNANLFLLLLSRNNSIRGFR